MQYVWVTKFITRRDLEEHYRHHVSYAIIEQVKGGYKIGFAIPKSEIVDGKMPVDTGMANEFDIKEIVKWRVQNNVYPR